MTFFPRPRAELLQVFVILLVALAAPLLMPKDPPADTLKPIVFDQERYDKSARRKPDVVMIGNSMLNTRVDKKLFDQLAAPNSISYVAEGGTRSTVWYLKFKNFVLPLEPLPKVVFFFYRDYDFTAPWLHLDGEYLDNARKFMKPEDEALLEWARNMGGVVPRNRLDFYLPDYTTAKVRSRVNDLAIDTAAFGRGKEGDTELQNNLGSLFDFQNLRANVFDAGAAANDLVPADMKMFSVDPFRNLLEKLNSQAKERGIRLVFYRVKRRPNEQNIVVQDAELRAYTAAFRAWAESQGHLLLDETEDPRLLLSMYHDGDHLGKAAMETYTHMFFERVKFCLPTPPAAAPAVP